MRYLRFQQFLLSTLFLYQIHTYRKKSSQDGRSDEDRQKKYNIFPVFFQFYTIASTFVTRLHMDLTILYNGFVSYSFLFLIAFSVFLLSGCWGDLSVDYWEIINSFLCLSIYRLSLIVFFANSCFSRSALP
jgi:hypothetical protein